MALPPPTDETQIRRVRLPRTHEGEVLGIVIGMMGGSRMRVNCKDGKERLCRIPGRMKNTVWVRDGDIVIIKPWSIQGDTRADIVWRYNPLQVQWLRRNGHI